MKHMEPRRTEPVEAYIALGSNLGDREHYLNRAIRSIDHLTETRVTGCSSLYETDPVGYEEQPCFLNMAASVLTRLQPHVLLEQLLDLENRLERKRSVRWGPRTIDLDLLLYGDERIQSETLTVPHPRMWGRAFVILPLLDIMDEERLRCYSNQDLGEYVVGDGVRLWKRVVWEVE